MRLKPPRAETADGDGNSNRLSANGNGHPHALRTVTGDGRRETGAARTESESRCASGNESPAPAQRCRGWRGTGGKRGVHAPLGGLVRVELGVGGPTAAADAPAANNAGANRKRCGGVYRSRTDPCVAVDIATATPRRDRAHDATMAHREPHTLCALRAHSKTSRPDNGATDDGAALQRAALRMATSRMATHKRPEAIGDVATDAVHRSPGRNEGAALRARNMQHAACNRQPLATLQHATGG